MQVIVGKRRDGKTTKLVELMAENPWGVMVCPHSGMVKLLRDQYPDLEPERFVTVDQVLHGALNGKRNDLYIDDVNQIIYSYLKVPNLVRVVTITED